MLKNIWPVIISSELDWILIFVSLQGAGMILSLEHSVPERLKSSFKRLFVVTIIIVTSLYLSFGWCGYLSFGPDTKDLITQNLDPPEEGGRSFWAGLIKICLAIALIFTYPVMLFPVIKVLKPRLEQFCGCTKVSPQNCFQKCQILEYLWHLKNPNVKTLFWFVPMGFYIPIDWSTIFRRIVSAGTNLFETVKFRNFQIPSCRSNFPLM